MTCALVSYSSLSRSFGAEWKNSVDVRAIFCEIFGLVFFVLYVFFRSSNFHCKIESYFISFFWPKQFLSIYFCCIYIILYLQDLCEKHLSDEVSSLKIVIINCNSSNPPPPSSSVPTKSYVRPQINVLLFCFAIEKEHVPLAVYQ